MALRVCVIGAGPAGMTAASVAAQNGFQTVLIEHGERVGRKILLTGNGKCNFTNLHLDESCYHAGTEKFAARALSHFGADDAVRWFRTLGIEPLERPLTTIHDALTGPIPILVTAGSVAMGGMSWAMGWEQQVMMRCVKGAGGGAIAIGAGKFMESVLGQGDSGCLF